MTFSWAPAGVRSLIACLPLILFVHCAAVQAQQQMQTQVPEGAEASASSADRTHPFHLAPQPLAEALKTFRHLSDLAILAPAPLLDGKTSSAVEGDLRTREALERMLNGTGLHAEFTGPDEAIIMADAAPPQPAQEQATGVPADAPIGGIDGNETRRAFAAVLQANMTRALCANPAAVPGSFRLLARLRIDENGRVVKVDVVESSGLAARDAAVAHALRGLALDMPPPPGLPQPVAVLLRPAGNGVHIRCP
ncbi:STN domain-containing protein [Trinickia sp. NRRL B-1857]|uniref:STN domain-containing protein n=1 Tax=Trinickia sp. NRRL B-1857 TaxID=3162879 RepID=UPI003D2A26F5